jgi:hypothetical protein
VLSFDSKTGGSNGGRLAVTRVAGILEKGEFIARINMPVTRDACFVIQWFFGKRSWEERNASSSDLSSFAGLLKSGKASLNLYRRDLDRPLNFHHEYRTMTVYNDGVRTHLEPDHNRLNLIPTKNNKLCCNTGIPELGNGYMIVSLRYGWHEFL